MYGDERHLGLMQSCFRASIVQRAEDVQHQVEAALQREGRDDDDGLIPVPEGLGQHLAHLRHPLAARLAVLAPGAVPVG